MPTIRAVDVVDVRFPTSLTADGSDAMNKDGDYSAAYVVAARPTIPTLAGYGFTFTIGRGNDLCAEAARQRALRWSAGTSTTLVADLGGTYRRTRSRTRSCAGSGRRRASCTSRWPR